MKLIGTLFCLLLAARANAVTIVVGDPTNPVPVTISGGAALSTTTLELRSVNPAVVMPTFPAGGATTHLDSTVKESAVAGAGDDLFPVAYEVDTSLAGSLTDGDYGRPKIDTRGATFIHGGEIDGVPMVSRGLGIFGTRATTTSNDQATRPMIWLVGNMTRSLQFFDTGSGPWVTMAIQLGNVNGESGVTAEYGQFSGTVFSEGGVTGIAKYVKVVGTSTVDSVEDIIVAKVTPTIFSATAYVAEGTVGDVMEFTGAARVSGQGGIIHTVTVADDAGQNASLVIWFFSQSITPSSDTQQISITEADMENYLGQVAIAAGNYESTGTGSSAMRSGLTIAFQANATSIFAVMKTKGTPNWSATDDLTIGLGIGPD